MNLEVRGIINEEEREENLEIRTCIYETKAIKDYGRLYREVGLFNSLVNCALEVLEIVLVHPNQEQERTPSPLEKSLEKIRNSRP